MGLLLLVDDAEAVVVAQGNDKLGEFVIRDAGAKLAIERVGGRLAQGEPIDVLDRLGQLGRVEQRAFDLLDVAFEPLISGLSRLGSLGLLLPRRPLFDPVANLRRQESPQATNFVGGHSLVLGQFADRVAIVAQMGGNFLDRQPALFHKGFPSFTASESFPVRRAFGQHCRGSVR